jgi:CheY-like chemotaxis protein
VDDSLYNLNVLELILNELRSFTFDIHTALNGELAVRKVAELSINGPFFNCIFMDLNMPVKDGYKVRSSFSL